MVHDRGENAGEIIVFERQFLELNPPPHDVEWLLRIIDKYNLRNRKYVDYDPTYDGMFDSVNSEYWIIRNTIIKIIKRHHDPVPLCEVVYSISPNYLLNRIINAKFLLDDNLEFNSRAVELMRFVVEKGRKDDLFSWFKQQRFHGRHNFYTPEKVVVKKGAVDVCDFLLSVGYHPSKKMLMIDTSIDILSRILPCYKRSFKSKYFLRMIGDVNNSHIIQLFLLHGVDVNYRDKGGNTPIYEACRLFNEVAIEYLLMNGANPDVVTAHEHYPLTTLIKNFSPSKELIDLMISKGADVHHMNSRGESPFDYLV